MARQELSIRESTLLALTMLVKPTAQRVGILQSLLVTCRLHEVDAYTYLAVCSSASVMRFRSVPCRRRDAGHPVRIVASCRRRPYSGAVGMGREGHISMSVESATSTCRRYRKASCNTASSSSALPTGMAR